MRLRLFNHHKLKRKIKRHLGHGVIRRTRRGQNRRHRLQDASWQYTARNPYYVWAHGQGERRRYLELLFGLLTLLTTISIVLWHPFFRIREINVSGQERIKSADMVGVVESNLTRTVKGIFPAGNFFLVPLSSIEQTLLKQFPLQAVHIKKVFPRTLAVQVEEKISMIIYDNGRAYSYLGLDGKLVQNLRSVRDDEWQNIHAITASSTIERIHTPAMAQLTAELGDYPIVYDEQAGNSGQPALSADSAQGVVAWWQYFQRQNKDRRLGYFKLTNDGGAATIHFTDSHEVRVRLEADLDNQFTRLQSALEQKESRSARTIDVRYPGRVYWQ